MENYEWLFGGTFDPVHVGHLAIIHELQKLTPRLPIRLLPCAIPALKKQPLTTFKQRVEMLKLATSGLSDISIDEREVQRNRTSYSVETLLQLRHEFPDKNFILVMGADSLISLRQWYRWQELSSLCHLLVVNRPGISANQLVTELEQSQFEQVNCLTLMGRQSAGLSLLLTMPEKVQSSTEIRETIANNLELDSMLSESVIEYIHRYDLYLREKY